MTAPVQPDASTEAAAAAMYHAQNAANGVDWTWADLEQPYRDLWLGMAAAATPIIAAAVEAQARADERERVAAELLDWARIASEGGPLGSVWPCCESCAEKVLAHAAAIARAGTSGVTP